MGKRERIRKQQLLVEKESAVRTRQLGPLREGQAYRVRVAPLPPNRVSDSEQKPDTAGE
jgi:hypothetical protein